MYKGTNEAELQELKSWFGQTRRVMAVMNPNFFAPRKSINARVMQEKGQQGSSSRPWQFRINWVYPRSCDHEGPICLRAFPSVHLLEHP